MKNIEERKFQNKRHGIMLKRKMSCSNKNVSVLDMDVVGGLSKVVFFARLLKMGDIAGWVDIGLEEHSYSWSALRPSLTQGINDTHVGTFGLTTFFFNTTSTMIQR